MKYIFSLLVCLHCLPPVLSSQSWLDNNPQWVTYRITGPGGPGIEYLSVQGDTFLAGQSAKILRGFIDRVSGNDFSRYRVARQNGDTVWCWNPYEKQFFIQYNLSLQAGQSVSVPNIYSNSFINYIIDSVGTVDISGQTLRFQQIHFSALGSFVCYSTILEKIGLDNGYCVDLTTGDTTFSGYHFFVDEPNWGFLDGPDWTFCQFHNDLFAYKTGASPCEGLVAAEEARLRSAAVVSPNPFYDYFNVEVPAGKKIAAFRLFSMMGELAIQITEPVEPRIFAGSLPPGIYLLEVEWHDRCKSYHRVVKR